MNPNLGFRVWGFGGLGFLGLGFRVRVSGLGFLIYLPDFGLSSIGYMTPMIGFIWSQGLGVCFIGLSMFECEDFGFRAEGL